MTPSPAGPAGRARTTKTLLRTIKTSVMKKLLFAMLAIGAAAQLRAASPGTVTTGHDGASLVFYIDKQCIGTATVRLAFTGLENTEVPATQDFTATGSGEFLRLLPIDPDRTAEAAFSWSIVPGRLGAEHSPAAPYRLPVGAARCCRRSASTTVTAVAPAEIGLRRQEGIASFCMWRFSAAPEEEVYPVRGGLVTEVDFYAPQDSGDEGNAIRIEHADGTIAEYRCLGAVAVAPGDRVTVSDAIGRAGTASDGRAAVMVGVFCYVDSRMGAAREYLDPEWETCEGAATLRDGAAVHGRLTRTLLRNSR